MNPFVFACIVPHGSEIIETLSGGRPELMARTRASLESLGARMRQAAPEVLVVLTPHGVRLDEAFAVSDCERMEGSVEDGGASVGMQRPVDRVLARRIVQTARADGLPVMGVNFATAKGPLSCLPLDWGAIVPLTFMPEVPVVVITPTRQRSFADQLRFGAALARAVGESGRRAGLIASCDWAHAHREDGPYGYHPAASRLDELVVNALKADDLEALARLDPRFVDDAKPDGIWQALILAGAIPKGWRRTEVLSYEVPTYFGLICAGVTPVSPNA
ncbi:extradiol ring-cleavage dioxygenase [Alicyclobacillus sp.]|uniref:DODA-type extradiol aromatic ring-opening family dioxygenase n=1 Tax=Alicyclobacillus sp. TaxID=61169 RepID=UPI0025BDB319|nr:extradiol ring-cleavage dioxygenase [Alicyclobacillus sp.]MCL6518127.1 extradiol ring-cleavage dioxygenase [Alicyclobacillus sp.]